MEEKTVYELLELREKLKNIQKIREILPEIFSWEDMALKGVSLWESNNPEFTSINNTLYKMQREIDKKISEL